MNTILDGTPISNYHEFSSPDLKIKNELQENGSLERVGSPLQRKGNKN